MKLKSSSFAGTPEWISDIIDIINQHFLSELTQKVDSIMVTVADIKAATEALKAQVDADDALIASIAAGVDTIQQKLADAIASGGNPVVLQAIQDDLDTVKASLTRQTAAEQAVVDDENSTP